MQTGVFQAVLSVAFLGSTSQTVSWQRQEEVERLDRCILPRINIHFDN